MKITRNQVDTYRRIGAMSSRECLGSALNLCQNGYSERAIVLIEAWFTANPKKTSPTPPPVPPNPFGKAKRPWWKAWL